MQAGKRLQESHVSAAEDEPRCEKAQVKGTSHPDPGCALCARAGGPVRNPMLTPRIFPYACVQVPLQPRPIHVLAAHMSTPIADAGIKENALRTNESTARVARSVVESSALLTNALVCRWGPCSSERKNSRRSAKPENSRNRQGSRKADRKAATGKQANKHRKVGFKRALVAETRFRAAKGSPLPSRPGGQEPGMGFTPAVWDVYAYF